MLARSHKILQGARRSSSSHEGAAGSYTSPHSKSARRFLRSENRETPSVSFAAGKG